jgi:hypothetical protein
MTYLILPDDHPLMVDYMPQEAPSIHYGERQVDWRVYELMVVHGMLRPALGLTPVAPHSYPEPGDTSRLAREAQIELTQSRVHMRGAHLELAESAEKLAKALRNDEGDPLLILADDAAQRIASLEQQLMRANAELESYKVMLRAVDGKRQLDTRPAPEWTKNLK